VNLNLIGKLIRCIFPKCSQSTTSRILEGEVISIQSSQDQRQSLQNSHTESQDDNNGFWVKLLVDKEYTDKMPFLNIMEQENVINNGKKISASEMKRRKFEEIIKGPNKVIVSVLLLAADSIPTTSTTTTNEKKTDITSCTPTPLKWVIRKWVPIGSSSSKRGSNTNTARYVGDGHDSIAQQEKNFRWLSTYRQYQTMKEDDFHIGEVIHVEPCLDSSSVDLDHLLVDDDDKKSNGKHNIKNVKPSSLATVIVQRMALPELTKMGRLAHHKNNEIFDLTLSSKKNNNNINNNKGKKKKNTFKVPIEDLIVIGQNVQRGSQELTTQTNNELFSIYSYNPIEEMFYRNNKTSSKNFEAIDQICHRCERPTEKINVRQCMYTSKDSNNETTAGSVPCMKWCCLDCDRFLRRKGMSMKEEQNNWCGPCCLGICDCFVCTKSYQKSSKTSLMNSIIKTFSFEKLDDDDNPPKDIKKQGNSTQSFLGIIRDLVEMVPSQNFDLPFDFIDNNHPLPKSEPYDLSESSPKRKRKQPAKNKRNSPSPRKLQKGLNSESNLNTKDSDTTKQQELDEAQFRSTCARCISYNEAKNKSGVRQNNNSAAHAARLLAVARNGGKKSCQPGVESKIEEKNSSGRAARVNKRRMTRDLIRFGMKQDKDMTGKEHALRFGKSLTHGFGVFTDEEINAGDLIVEYRGILIGHAVADKREKVYEKAKIGSDYMFRIDRDTVCDATYQGNVARFINASCTPNCYTQIITLSGTKRIAIYAKKHIMPGEELSYDYKFQPEFDETKRIPCNCGTTDCRGFMNWDKRYIAIQRNPNEFQLQNYGKLCK